MKRGTIFNTHMRMISTSGEIAERTFEKIQGKLYTWYVTTDEAKADNIYVVTDNKDGMAGRTCDFKLVDGTIDAVEAPWHSSPYSLLKDTGVDYTATSRISYIIAEDRERVRDGHSYSTVDTYYGVLEHVEDKLMTFSTPSERGKYFANKLGKKVYVTRVSFGGSSRGMEKPDKEYWR